MPIVRPLPKGTFTLWLKSIGKLGGQHKVPRLNNERKIVEQVLKIANNTKYNTMKLLAGKTAIVTGAARGIGEGVAVKLAEQGANIAFTYVSDSSAEKATIYCKKN